MTLLVQGSWTKTPTEDLYYLDHSLILLLSSGSYGFLQVLAIKEVIIFDKINLFKNPVKCTV